MVAMVNPIRIGSRFLMYGMTYEISYFDSTSIRYHPLNGTAPLSLPCDDLLTYVRDGRAVFTYVAATNTRTRTPQNRILNKGQLDSAARHIAYVEGLVKIHGWAWPLNECVETIASIAANRKEAAPGYSTVAKWKARYIESTSPRDNCDRTWLRGRGSRYTEDAWIVIDSLLEKYYLTKDLRSIADAWRVSTAEIGVDDERRALFQNGFLPSIKSIERRVASYDLFHVLKSRHGAKAAHRLLKRAGRSREHKHILETVFADGHYLDVLVVVEDSDGNIISVEGCRPYVTVIVDCAARAVLSAVVTLCPFSSSTVLAAVRKAVVADGLLPRGRFQKLCVDNGCDFISDGLKRAACELLFSIEWGEPASPDARAIVERFFGKLSRMIQQLPAAIRASPLSQQRKDINGLPCITVSQLDKHVQALVALDFKTPNASLGRRPVKFWNEQALILPPLTYDAQTAHQATCVPERRIVTDGRVRVDDLFWSSPALKVWEEKERMSGRTPWVDVLIDEFNLSQCNVKPLSPTSSIYLADNTRERYAKGLTLYEHTLVKQRAKDILKRDMDDLKDLELEIERLNILRDLQNSASQTKRRLKAFARIVGAQAIAASAARAAAQVNAGSRPTASQDIADVPTNAAAATPKAPVVEEQQRPSAPPSKAEVVDFLSMFAPQPRDAGTVS